MLSFINRFFEKINGSDDTADSPGTRHDVRVATCALLLEMAKIDESFSPEELDTIISLLQQRYGLSAEDTEELLAAGREELKGNIDYWHFTNLINAHYSVDEKLEIIELLWRVVFVDGKMDKYERYLMHKLANTLRLSHDQLIAAKLKVRQG
ncbi:MAG: TerB family tellurite resistance protein [Desulfobacterales bacterium]|jgi:uncharacterized tellurite resistance protein B-like protein